MDINLPWQPSTVSSRRLSSLAERDETQQERAQSALNVAVPSPVVLRTPATVGRVRPPFEEMHPSKAHTTSSSSFDFQYARPTFTLGADAQRMMDEIREETLRIKVQLAAEREEEKCNARINDAAISGGRRIATPRGKVGRFSDVHMAEFKKMDSIAGHASAFRAQPGRFAPATGSLKRSQSKAKLASREEVSRGGNTASQPASLENTPAKRARTYERQSSSQTTNSKPGTPTLSRSQSILSSITTPTQASLARAASIEKPSQIPTMSKSPSKYSLAAPRGLVKSATMNNINDMTTSESVIDFPSTPSKLDRFKSILRRPIIGTGKPVAVTQTSVPAMTSSNKLNFDKELPSLPTTPGLERSKSTIHMNVTPRTVTKSITTLQNSPSPMKSGLSRASSNMRLGDVYYPSLAARMTDDNQSQNVNYPVLSPARPLSEAPAQAQAKAKSPPPSVPGTFTFRSDKTIDFGTSPRGFGSSPGQSSIRQVRPSIFPTTMPGAFPDSNKENIGGFPAIPHGIPNKKRRRVDSDDEKEEKELEGSPAKKRKGLIADLGRLMEPKLQAEKLARKSKIPSPSKKGGLSLNRLNMLARPKVRK